MDIVGHFRLMPPKTERHYTADEPPPVSRSYDILRSAPKFEAHTFETVWHDIFEFAATPHAYRPAATGLHKPVAIAAAASGYWVAGEYFPHEYECVRNFLRTF